MKNNVQVSRRSNGETLIVNLANVKKLRASWADGKAAYVMLDTNKRLTADIDYDVAANQLLILPNFIKITRTVNNEEMVINLDNVKKVRQDEDGNAQLVFIDSDDFITITKSYDDFLGGLR